MFCLAICRIPPIPPLGGREVRGSPPRTLPTAPPRHPAAAKEAALHPGPPHPANRRARGEAALLSGPPRSAARRPGEKTPSPPDHPHGATPPRSRRGGGGPYPLTPHTPPPRHPSAWVEAALPTGPPTPPPRSRWEGAKTVAAHSNNDFSNCYFATIGLSRFTW